MLWNKGQRQVRYDWLSGGLCVSGEQESLSKARLTVMLDDLLSGQGKLRYSSSVPLIYNEHAPVSKLLWDTMVYLFHLFNLYLNTV